MRTARTDLHELLVETIHAVGPITFADYMEACLYHPEFGYYNGSIERRRADYYTSVDMSPIFGRLIARQIYEMWMLLASPSRFTIAEIGAGTGSLARQILDFSRDELPKFYEAIDYRAIEISAKRLEVAASALADHILAGHASVLKETTEVIPQGCILTNEFFDALPVHRLVMHEGKLEEIYVDAVGDELIERRMPVSSPEVQEYFRRQEVELREGQHAEAAVRACDSIEKMGGILGSGFVLTIDYGREARELYDEHHMNGSMLAYCNHRASEEYYRAPGEQDLTAHVSFTALDLWGRKNGLIRTGLASQTHFLLSLAHQSNFADISNDAGETTQHASQIRSRLQFKSLIFPDGMGETFQVMVQHKGIAAPELTGLKLLKAQNLF
ncbi:MAG: SAM-dependent methyltransferase [Candidatus Acidiferrales bacterium]